MAADDTAVYIVCTKKVRLYIWILLYQAVNHGSALYHFHLLTVGQIDCNLAQKKKY